MSGAAANYVYDRVGLTRVTFLPAGFSWVGRVLGQVSDRNLLYSEQLGAFWDYALVSQVEPIPDAVNKANLSSVGVALHSTLSRYADLRFDLGWQLVPAPGTDKCGVFGDIAVVVGY